MTSAAARYAAVYDAALAADRFSDHRLPGDHWVDLAELFRLDPRRPRDANLAAVAEYLEPSDVFLDVGGGAGRVSAGLGGLRERGGVDRTVSGDARAVHHGAG